uniref:Uncharacterized protein n=1 Tax=Arundo donax TaxID=35708 RepID=A0A0A9TXH1_ARUDO
MSGMAGDFKFLLWLLLLRNSSSCFGSELDIKCLKTLQQSVVDPRGILKSSWNFGNSTNGFIFSFTGVVCWFPGENRVYSLRLSNLGLEGQFPQGLEHCTSMFVLDLSSNNFSGPIPSDIAQQLPYVTDLELSYNKFSGEIPVGISSLTSLSILNLQHNRLTGQIPGQLSEFNQLTKFNVADNQLSGPIPYALQEFPPSNFAGNQGLCGAPLDYCPSKTKWRLKRARLHNDQ